MLLSTINEWNIDAHYRMGVKWKYLHSIYWIGQKIHSGFSITPQWKTQMKLLAHPNTWNIQ